MHSKDGANVLAATSSVPISVILRTVWNDMGDIFVRLRGQSVTALSIVVVLRIVGAVPAISSNPVFSETFDLMSTMAILPFEIAIFRLLVLDETATGYHFAISTVRFQRMLGWSVALWAIGTIPIYLPYAAGIAAIVMAILLPAIAVDAPGASIGNAFADTRGHAWFILKAYLTVVLPFVVLILLATVLAWLGGGSDVFSRSGGGSVAGNAFFGALGFLNVTSVAIVSARLLMMIGDRVKGVVPGAPE
jgi:hypothetical protein